MVVNAGVILFCCARLVCWRLLGWVTDAPPGGAPQPAASGGAEAGEAAGGPSGGTAAEGGPHIELSTVVHPDQEVRSKQVPCVSMIRYQC